MALAAINCRRTSHLNLVVEDYQRSVAQLAELFDATFLLHLPRPDWEACLVEIGGVILELFAPPNFLLHARLGPHFLGIEYEATMAETRAALAAHEVRIVRDLDVVVHIDPADCHGVAFEFYEGSFYDNDPPTLTFPMRPAAYWRDEHPLGLTGLKAYTLGVSDIEAASRFLQSFMRAKPLYDETRPAIAARALGLQVADSTIELLTPTGDGPFRRALEHKGQGICSAVFRTKSLSHAKSFFTARGVATAPGTAPTRLAIDPAASLGVAFEFSE
jgi:hypothetical protein